MAEIEDVDIYYAVDRRDDILTNIYMCVFSVYHSNTCKIAASPDGWERSGLELEQGCKFRMTIPVEK